MDNYLTSFSFKGTRTYVQGPDIINELFNVKPNICSFNIKFHFPLQSQGCWNFWKTSDSNSESINAQFCSTGSYQDSSGRRFSFGLLPDITNKIHASIAYDESLLAKNQHFIEADNAMNFLFSGTYSFAEELVSAMKALCQSQSGELAGWRVASLSFIDTHAVSVSSKCNISIIRSISNRYRLANVHRLSRSGQRLSVGQLEFVRVNP